MLGVLTAVYMSAHKPWHAAVLAAAAMGIAGEQAAAEAKGMGSFHVGLFDAISNVTLDDIWKEKRFLLIVIRRSLGRTLFAYTEGSLILTNIHLVYTMRI